MPIKTSYKSQIAGISTTQTLSHQWSTVESITTIHQLNKAGSPTIAKCLIYNQKNIASTCRLLMVSVMKKIQNFQPNRIVTIAQCDNLRIRIELKKIRGKERESFSKRGGIRRINKIIRHRMRRKKLFRIRKFKDNRA